MHDDARGFSPAELRRIFHRKSLAAARQRAALARLLRITETEATALAHLAAHGQLTPRALGGLLGLSSGGTTALVHRLARAGHVERRPHPRDGRSILLTPTPAFLELAEELYAPMVADMDQVSSRLTEQERAIVGSYLDEMAAISERHAERLASEGRDDGAHAVVPPATGLWA